MATGLTNNYSFSYPLSTDPVNVASDIQSLATGIDTFLANPAFINNINIDGGSVITSNPTANIFNTNSTTINIGSAATSINIGSSLGKTNFSGSINVGSGKDFQINNVSILNETTLGSSVTSSSLTSVGTISTGVWDAATITANRGGTGISSYSIGDIIYASGSETLSKLSDVATGSALISGGVGSAPEWGKIGLSTHVSGTLPVANGGTGVTSSTGSGNTVLSQSPALTGVPTAPTAESGNTTTQIATTEFVQATLLGFLPERLGNAGKYLYTDGSDIFWGTIGTASPTPDTVALRDADGGLSVVSPTEEGSTGVREITMSTSEPSGGLDGDMWVIYSL